MATLSANIDVPCSKMNCEDIINKFFESRKNSNCVLDLEELLLSEDESIVLSSVHGARELFVRVLEKGMLTEVPNSNSADAHEKFRLWLLDRYHDFIDHLLKYMQHINKEIQEAAFITLMHFVKAEGENPLKSSPKNVWKFPIRLFDQTMTALMSNFIDNQHIINALQEYSSYDDIKLHILKAILNSFSKESKVTDLFLGNCFLLLCTVQYPNKFFDGDDTALCSRTYISQKDNQSFYLKEKAFRKLYSNVWSQFLKYKLPLSLHRRVLIVLHKRVLPHFINPCLLTDFLTDSYNKGGITSLLALKGLFFLIEKHNVEYPDFFLKLYALFNEDILNSKFSAKFFYLSNLFLSSTHLPAYIVAAFVKKLSRLALSLRASTILVIIPFIANLLIRHPALKILIHHPDSEEIQSDPYNFNEPDPAISNAIESSLWEIKTLQNHIIPDVARKAKRINSNLPKMEADLSNVLESSMDSLYQKKRKCRFKEVPLAIQRPSASDTWWIL